MKDLMLTFWKDESGQDMAEYALLLALIAVVIAAAVILLQQAIAPRFEEAADILNAAG